MKNILRTILSAVCFGFGVFCFVQGNPEWLVTMGYADGLLPAITAVIGLGLGATAALHVWFSETAKTTRV